MLCLRKLAMDKDVPSEEDLNAIREMRDEELPWEYTDSSEGGTKLFEKMKANPFVLIGCLGTVGALSYGLLQFKRGNTERSQFAMRLRVFAQGGTVIALLIGAAIANFKEKKK